MRTFRNFILTALLALLIIPVLQSCKKGANDPGLSLASRKSRVAGTWSLTALSGSGSTSESGWISDQNNYTSTIDIEFDGINYFYTQTFDGQDPDTKDTARSISYTFEKDGTYTSETIDSDTSSFPGLYQKTIVNKRTEKGTWNFTGNVGDVKAKSQLVLSPDSWTNNNTNTTIYNDGSPEVIEISNTSGTIESDQVKIWEIDRLAGKEMVVIFTNKTSYVSEWSDLDNNNQQVTVTVTQTTNITQTMTFTEQ